jgi:hypothetical protein
VCSSLKFRGPGRFLQYDERRHPQIDSPERYESARVPVRFTEMRLRASRFTPAVQARSGGLFPIVGVAASLLLLTSAFALVGAVVINDPAGVTGGLVFSLALGAVLVLTTIARRNIKLFATPELIGVVGPFGGVRTCPRVDFAELRLVRHGDVLGTYILWRFPTLHVRRRDGVDAFSTSAYLYRKDGLRDLAQYLGVPLDLSGPAIDLA